MLIVLLRKYWAKALVVFAMFAIVFGALALHTARVNDAYEQGSQDVRHEVIENSVKEYKNVRQKADRVVKPRGVDDAKRMLREYKTRRAND